MKARVVTDLALLLPFAALALTGERAWVFAAVAGALPGLCFLVHDVVEWRRQRPT